MKRKRKNKFFKFIFPFSFIDQRFFFFKFIESTYTARSSTAVATKS